MFKTKNCAPFLKIKFHCTKKNKHAAANTEQYIINLHQTQTENGISENNRSLINDQRRIIFISLIGLYKTWQTCPAAILYSSIFMLPLKKKWIYSATKYKKEISKSIIGQMNLSKDPEQFNKFLNILRWKDSQNLLFCMLDEYKPLSGIDPIIAPFWQHVNQTLIKLYNPITKETYKPIPFNVNWWKHAYGELCTPKYNVPTHAIFQELYFVTSKFKSIKEILYQSNPESFNIITSYVSSPSNSSHPLFNSIKCSTIKSIKGFVETTISTENKKMDTHGFVAFENGLITNVNKNKNEGIWMISVDYFNDV